MSAEGPIDVCTPPPVGSELGNTATTSPPTSSHVSIKDGKAIFKQKAIDWSAGIESMKALVAFHELLGSQRSPLSLFPKEHLPLLAKHVHESDKTIGALLKSLRKTLFPHSQSIDEEAGQLSPSNKISNSVLQDAVMNVAIRTNYGMDNAPTSLCIWRWEANDLADVQGALGDKESAATRKAQRVKAKQELHTLFDALPEEERISLLKGSKKDKPAVKSLSHDSKSETTAQGTEETKLSKINKKASLVTKNKVNEKSAAVMASFFNKAARKHGESVTSRSDFEKHFIPFAVHKNATLAPINRFCIKPPIKTQVRLGSEIIIIEDDPNSTNDGTTAADIDSLRIPPMEIDPEIPPRDLLFQFISRVPSFRLVRSSQYEAPLAMTTAGPSTSCQSSIATDARRRLKSRADLSVRGIMTGLVEAEVNGDEAETRRLLDLMKDRRKVSIKLLQFHDNVRPPYYGTWTKSSSYVGPRTPFAKDLVTFDYSHDSGDEWEEEEVEGAEELISENGSQGEGEDEFEEDDWLVGDDEAIETASGPSRSVSPHASSSTDEKKKRKAESNTTIAAKKRRQIVGPLIPFSKGPIYEDVISMRNYELFNDHSIHLVNDSHIGLDPFTFVSTCVEDYSQFLVQSEAEKRHTKNPTNSSDVPSDFIIPAIPPHVLASYTNGTSLDGTSAVKKGPTFSLPLEYYPAFLRAIDGSDRPKVVLVDELFKQFKNMPGVSSLRKIAIESKLSEVAAKEKKVWKVKHDVWLHVGLSPP